MSTLLVNDITRYNSEILNLPGRVVTATHYVRTEFKSAYTGSGGAGTVLDTFSFEKKYSERETMVWGLWSISNLRQGNESQYWTCNRGSTEIGYYRLRHSNNGWSMVLDCFSWLDTTAPKGNNLYTLNIKDYVSYYWYNYPTNLSGSPNANSTFLMMEISI